MPYHFTFIEDQFLKDNYLTMSQCGMSKVLKRSKNSARQRLKVLGIKVPKEISQKFKIESRVQKGSIPFNKGMKQHEYLSAASIENSKLNQFKKGGLPHNTLKDFDISQRSDKSGKIYNFIRTEKAVWIPLHRFVYEKNYGKIKKGMKLIFKDSNQMNCNLENLELLTNAELMAKNSYHIKYPKEIAEIIQLRGVLTRQINKHLKNITDEK